MLDDVTGVHAAHCCSKHGCKYGYTDQECPVAAGMSVQLYECEICSWAAQELENDGTIQLEDIVDGWKLHNGDLCLHVKVSPLVTREIRVKLPRGTKNA